MKRGASAVVLSAVFVGSIASRASAQEFGAPAGLNPEGLDFGPATPEASDLGDLGPGAGDEGLGEGPGGDGRPLGGQLYGAPPGMGTNPLPTTPVPGAGAIGTTPEPGIGAGTFGTSPAPGIGAGATPDEGGDLEGF